MKERVQGCVTVGVAMVGAGALALAPMAPQPAVQMRADQVRTVNVSDMKLLATTTPTPASLLAALQILGTGVGGSVQRLATDTVLGALGPIAAAQAIAGGDDVALKVVIRSYVDAPLEIIDPTIFALDNVLPAPYGQDSAPDQQASTSDVFQFRQALYALRQAARAALGVSDPDVTITADLVTTKLAADPVGDPVFTVTRLAQGLGESGQRLLTDTALGLLGPVAAAQALAKGDNEGLYKVVESYVDAPLHIADPTIFAIDDVLPKPFGGDTEKDPTKMHGSIVDNIRADVLIPARDAIKPGLKNVLGVPTKATNVKTVDAQVSGSSTATKKPTSHRKPTNNPISSALKKLSKDVKKATAPKAEKADNT
jgi:hypothetical protein